MPPIRKLTASYSPHKQSGRGRAIWYDITGTRQQKLLPGPFNSPESRTAFARLQLELETSPASAVATREAITVAEVLIAYLDYAEKHYRTPDGLPTSEVSAVKVVVRAVRELYAETPAVEFGPLALKAARQKWVNEGRARTECNRRVRVVRRIFKWAVSEELVPPAVHQGLTTVAALSRGRTTAREMEPIGPVDDATVDATLPYLNRFVAGLVEFMRLTGCRPGEACAVRRCDIDTGGTIWLYRPIQHKTAHNGKTRTISIGPKAQELLKGFFAPDISAYLFSPARAVEELRAERSANRQTPKYPSHMKRNAARRKTAPARAPKARYNRTSFTQAIARACDSAFPPPAPLAQRDGETVAAWKSRLTDGQRKELAAWKKRYGWRPNQIRHSYATKVRKSDGLEAVQVLLGHSRADVTQIYAERNQELAATVAAKIG